VVAGLCGLLVPVPTLLALAYAVGIFGKLYFPSNPSAWIRPGACIVFGALMAALVVYPFQRIRWYLAAIVGTVIAFVATFGAAYAVVWLTKHFS